MENNNYEKRQINIDHQEMIHLIVAAKSILNVLGIRLDDIVVREGKRKRNGDDNVKKEEANK